MRLVLGMVVAAWVGWAGTAAAEVTGAGSTFAQLILMRWSHSFQAAQADAEFQPIGAALDYEPVGSQAGIMRIRDGAVDFGATDVPLPSAELQKLGLVQFPFVVGGIAIVVNLPGVEPGQLRLSGAVLADIYLGRVRTWSDLAITRLNPDMQLPDTAIEVVHRSDGSGTTYHVAGYLSENNPAWRAQVGQDLELQWPVGTGVKGNEAVGERVKATPNAIGYLDFAQAQRQGLSHVLLQNGVGNFVAPNRQGFQAAAAAAPWQEDNDFSVSLTGAKAADSYPLVSPTFALMPKMAAGTARSRAALAFFAWALDHGAADAEDLGYAALPGDLVEQVKRYWSDRLPGEG